jgi:hypothetical protein
MVVAGLLVVPAAALADQTSSGSNEGLATTTTGAPATPKATAALRATAVAWAKAFLTGSIADIRRMQGPECRSHTTSTLSHAGLELYLRAMRASMRQHLGVALDAVRIEDVELRNVTSRRGDAQVVYNLPQSKAGNFNWVEYTLHDGRWKVSDCRAPIGGEETSATGADAGTAPATPATT